MPADPFRGDFPHQHGVIQRIERDHPDVAGVALVAGPGMRDLRKRNPHADPPLPILTRLDFRVIGVQNRFLEGQPLAKTPLISLIKPIEATELQPRTGMSLGQPDVTIPYGALIEHKGSDGGRERFSYLGALYACRS